MGDLRPELSNQTVSEFLAHRNYKIIKIYCYFMLLCFPQKLRNFKMLSLSLLIVFCLLSEEISDKSKQISVTDFHSWDVLAKNYIMSSIHHRKAQLFISKRRWCCFYQMTLTLTARMNGLLHKTLFLPIVLFLFQIP